MQGATFHVDATQDAPTAKAGRLRLWRDDTMCGKTEDQLYTGWQPATPATGTFHVSEIERDNDGEVTRFAATYEMSCQLVGGQPGFEGSVAVNATAPPAPVPDAPAAPGPVTGLMATNVGPDGAGTNTTTLTWHNPAGYGDINIDMVQSSNHARLPAVIATGDTQQYRGRASRYYDGHVEFMDTRTYRVVARGPSGRLGPASLLTVLGTRLDIPDLSERVTIGHEVQMSGRLSESWATYYVKPADVMNGPGLAGRAVVLCRQSSVNYVDGACAAVDRTRTSADGHFTLSASPMQNSLYNVVVPATGQMVGNSSRVINALVAPQADLTAPESELATARASVRRGSVIHFSTSRARAGSRGVVRLQRYDGRTWRTVATKRLSATSGSRARRLAVPYRERGSGRHAYRVIKLGDAHHVNGYSRIVHVRVG